MQGAHGGPDGAHAEVDFSVVIPVYNNATTLDELIDRLIAVLEPMPLSFELILVDDGSRDTSFSILQARAARDPRVRAFALTRNFGSQAAVCAGFDRVRGRLAACMDADLENSPEDLPRLLEPLGRGYDLVCGYREKRDVPWLTRRLPSQLMNAYVRHQGGKRVRDVGCGMRAFQSWVVRDLEAEGEARRLLTPVFLRRARTVAEVPLSAAPSEASGGHSFLSLLGIAADYYLLTARRPFVTTGLVSAAALATGVVTAVLGSFAIGLALAGGGALGGLVSLLGEYCHRLYQLSQGTPFYQLRDTHGDDPSFADAEPDAPMASPPASDAPTSILLADLLHPNNQNKTFPYAAGCIGAYARDALGDRISVEVFRSPEGLGEAFRASPPKLLGFTNYVWNLELGYEVIRQAKASNPATVVVMGGPNYPIHLDEQRAFLSRHPLVDFYVYKEGEVPFLELLERLLGVDFDVDRLKSERFVLPGVHYLVDGELIAPLPAPRRRALDDFPSPYLGGLLDKFFTRGDLVPLIQTKRGCPFQCTFCVEGEDYYTKLGSVTTDRFRAELEYIARRMSGGPPRLHVADSNFGMYAEDLEICDVIAKVRESFGWPETIEVSTGKNRKERVLEAVQRTNGAIRFGPALQTTDPQTLENIKRSNISETVLMEMARAATDLDQRSYTELILNLPGDTVDSHLRSIRAAMEAGIQRIKMYPLVLLPGTELASEEARREFGLQTRFRVFPQCHGTYRFLDSAFPSVEIGELVIATNSMTFDDYLACKRFELSVEIFYNDIYLEEIHGLMRALELPMFEFVRRCHAAFGTFPAELKALYGALEHGVRDNLWESRDACLEHFRDPAHLEAYARDEYKNSLGTLKAIALLEQIEPLLEIARRALMDCVAEAGIDRPSLAEFVEDLIEYSRLRRRRILDSGLEPEGTFRFAFDRILEREFCVDPSEFRLQSPRRMRFWHDDAQARDIQALCAAVSNRALRARSFIYPQTDPGVNPYLRRSAFC